MEERPAITVERMVNLGDWELYRFTDDDGDEVVCRVALRVDEASGEVEYGVWRKDEGEPRATGRLTAEETEGWGDAARERALQELAAIYEEGLPEVRRGLDFRIGEAVEADEDEAGAGDDDEDE